MIGFLVSLFMAILFIGLGLPLVHRKIRRNHFYGVRVSKYAMKYDDIWYEVNEVGGKHFVIMGLSMLLISVFSMIYHDNDNLEGYFMLISILIAIVGSIFSIIVTHKLANNLAKEKGLKKTDSTG